MSGEEIPVRPLGRQDIHKLETALLVATLLRPDVIAKVRESRERITWIDSLAVAAAALAREKAGMSIVRIAEELGRTEATIRKHLKGETEAGKLVLETYERLKKEGFKIEIPEVGVRMEEITRVRREREELEAKVRKLEEEIRKVKEEHAKKINELKQSLEKALNRLKETVKLFEEAISLI